VAFILIDENGENMISVAPGANARLSKIDVGKVADIIKNASVLVVQMEIPIETIEEIYNIASQGNVIKILNPAPFKTIPLRMLKNIDIIVPNEGELFRLHSLLKIEPVSGEGRDKIIQASRDITSLGVKTIITTLGSKGCLIYEKNKDQIINVPALKVKAVDTVGAGDCFNGVLASKLFQGEPLVNAGKYATVAASIAVTRKGAQESMPFVEEIEERYKKLK
jgi:ribokinase